MHPPKALERTIRSIDSISMWSGKLFAWLIIPMVGGLVYEVMARYVFEAPTIWAYDTTYMLYGTHFMLGAAYTLSRGQHIRTDFFYRMWPARWQGTVDAVLYFFFFFPAIGFFLWLSADFAYDSWVQRERIVTSPWIPPVYPFKTVIPVAAGLLLLQGVAEFLRSLHAALKGKWL